MRLFSCGCMGCAGPLMASAASAPADAGSGGAPPPRSGGNVERSVLEDIAAASRILADQGVVDAFGHVSMRHPHAPDRFLMARAVAPALVTPEDIMEFTLESEPCENRGRSGFLERYIHGRIYASRPDVLGVVHSHSQSVIPFGLVDVPLKAMFHNAAFLAQGVPVFDISEKFGATDMLVGNNEKGDELARVLGDKPVVLMRAHGSVAVGPSLPTSVFRAVYTEVSAKMQVTATMLGGGSRIAALDRMEGELADAVNLGAASRAWQLWKQRVGFA